MAPEKQQTRKMRCGAENPHQHDEYERRKYLDQTQKVQTDGRADDATVMQRNAVGGGASLTTCGAIPGNPVHSASWHKCAR